MDSAGAKPLDADALQMFPVVTGRLDRVGVLLDVSEPTELEYELYGRAKGTGSLPDESFRIGSGGLALEAGERQRIDVPVEAEVGQAGWHFLVLKRNPLVSVHYTRYAPVGVKNLSKSAPHAIHANREWMFNRSLGLPYQTLCLSVLPAQPAYGAANVTGLWDRPVGLPSLWISAPAAMPAVPGPTAAEAVFDRPEWLELAWEEPQPVAEVQLLFDSSLDINLYPIAYAGTSQEANVRSTIASIVRDYRLLGRASEQEPWQVLADVRGNYRRNRLHRFEDGPRQLLQLRIEALATNGLDRAHLYSVRVRQQAREV
jgi:hypothetical protein